jgi:hypothetical protein
MKYCIQIIAVALFATLSTKSTAQITFDPATCTPMAINPDQDLTVPEGKMFVITYTSGPVSVYPCQEGCDGVGAVSTSGQKLNVHIPIPQFYFIQVSNQGSIYGYLIDLETYGITSDQDTSDCNEADSNNDGQVTVTDLLVLLGVFGASC